MQRERTRKRECERETHTDEENREIEREGERKGEREREREREGERERRTESLIKKNNKNKKSRDLGEGEKEGMIKEVWNGQGHRRNQTGKKRRER